jgi:uncharacterized membrane protein YbhN (UPF0104 family)
MAAKKEKMPPGLTGRILASVFSGVGLLIVLILYLAFYPTGFTLFQNIAVILVVLLAFVAIMAAVWVPWGMKFGYEEHKWQEPKKGKMPKEYATRKAASTIVGSIALSIVVLYLAFYSTGFSLWQKVAIFIVALLLWGAAKAAIWIPMGGCPE